MRRPNPAVTFKQQPGLGLVSLQFDPTMTFVLLRPEPVDDYARVVLGYIWIGPLELDLGWLDVFEVHQSAAVHGYGPLLYWSALEWCRERDAWMTPGHPLSSAAKELWYGLASDGRLWSETIDVEWHEHEDEILDAAYQAKRPLAGYQRALQNGNRFVRDEARRRRISDDVIRRQILDAGSAYFQRVRPP